MSEKDKLLNDNDMESTLLSVNEIPPFINHISNKNEFLCCCNLARKRIKEHHITTYNELKRRAMVIYDESNIHHEMSLKLFYIAALKHDPEDDKLIHSDWTIIGFQVCIINFRIKIRELILELEVTVPYYF